MKLSDLVYSTSAFSFITSSNPEFVSIPFCYDGQLMSNSSLFPLCNLTLKKTGSMRFRWNEVNSNRDSFFNKYLFSKKLFPVSLELIHSKVVYSVDLDIDNQLILLNSIGEAENAEDLRKGDGIVSNNPKILPVLTVADCLPIYLFDPVKNVFALVHSGWKGTGIALNAIKLANKVYNSNPSDFCVVIGPHIHSCCYEVDMQRANYFSSNYGEGCISKQADNSCFLSLTEANIRLLLDAGVSKNNILHCTDCTSCDTRLGSFRRETLFLNHNASLEERQHNFTPMAAYLTFNK